MNKPPDPSITLEALLSFRRFPYQPCHDSPDFLSVLVELFSPLAYPLWSHGHSRSGSDEALKLLYRSLNFDSMIHHYPALNRAILWDMVIWKPSLSNLFMIGDAKHTSCEIWQILWTPYKILHLISHSIMNCHCHHPPTVFMAICYSGGQIFRRGSMVISPQYLSRFGRKLTRSRGDFRLQCTEAKVKDYVSYPSHRLTAQVYSFLFLNMIFLCVYL